MFLVCDGTTQLASGLATAGDFKWTVPSSVLAGSRSGTGCTVRISIGSSSASTSLFDIVGPETAGFELPALDRQFVKGSTYRISWNYRGADFPIDMYLVRGPSTRRVTVSGASCVFPFRFAGIEHRDCVRESIYTYLAGDEWCPTQIDSNGNPLKRERCAEQQVVEEIQVANSVNSTLVSLRGFDWTIPEAGRTPTGDAFFLQLSSVTDRRKLIYSSTFSIVCAQYTVTLQLKASAGTLDQTALTALAAGIASASSLSETQVAVKEVSSGVPATVTFTFLRNHGHNCPIGGITQLNETITGGNLPSSISSVDPNYGVNFVRIDESDTETSEETSGGTDFTLIIVIAVVCSLALVILGVVVRFVHRRKRHHHGELHKSLKLAKDWRLARTASRRVYYYNEVTGETSWEQPREAPRVILEGQSISQQGTLPPGWTEGTLNGERYYYHDDGVSTSWERPNWIPHGWIPSANYYNEQVPQLEVASALPMDTAADTLPDGWCRAETEEHETYFYNANTGQVSWEDPATHKVQKKSPARSARQARKNRRNRFVAKV